MKISAKERKIFSMKRKILSVLLITTMVLSVLSGCSNDDESNSGTSSSDAIYGEVSAIDDSSITIKVGTMNMEKRGNGEKPSDGETMSQMKMPDANGANRSSLIELTGETKEIKFADGVVAREQKMGGFGRGNKGNPGEIPTREDGEILEMPSGEEGSRPKMPSSEGGTMPEMPTGEDGSMQGRPEDGNGQGDFSQMATKIELSDISVGDIVAITLDDDGNAKDILVMSMDEPTEQPSKTSGSDSAQANNDYKIEEAA